MKLTATEMDELAMLAHDFDVGLREQLNREDDMKAEANMGRLMRVARLGLAGIAAFWLPFVLYAVAMFCMHGCANEADARYEAMVAAYEASQTADLLSEEQDNFSDTEVDTEAAHVRAREPADPRFAECPSPCVIKIGATWCGPCRSERISEWLRASEWSVHSYDYDRDRAFCGSVGVDRLPTFIVIRNGREVARYVGADIEGFLPVLKAACK